MTKRLPLKVRDRVKMVRNAFPEHFPDEHTPLGKVGVVIKLKPYLEQQYNIRFEGFTARWNALDDTWYCTRNELRKLPDRKEGA